MKKLILLLLCLSALVAYSQDIKLFTHDWKLEKIETATDTLIAQPYSSIPTDPPVYEQIQFSNYDGYYGFMFGYYGNGIADDLVFDDALSQFTISYFYNHLGGMSPSEGYFTNNFIMDDSYQSILNPFKYSFRYENNLIYLDILNNEGSVATFFDDFLTTHEFPSVDFKIYPNPCLDFIIIKSDLARIEKLLIFNLTGKAVLTYKTPQHNKIDVSRLQKGSYILKIEHSKGIYRHKIIKN